MSSDGMTLYTMKDYKEASERAGLEIEQVHEISLNENPSNLLDTIYFEEMK